MTISGVPHRIVDVTTGMTRLGVLDDGEDGARGLGRIITDNEAIEMLGGKIRTGYSVAPEVLSSVDRIQASNGGFRAIVNSGKTRFSVVWPWHEGCTSHLDGASPCPSRQWPGCFTDGSCTETSDSRP